MTVINWLSHAKHRDLFVSFALFFAGCAVLLTVAAPELLAQARIPGADESSKLEAAGTLLRLMDTMLFTWGARLFAGICILSGGWALKEQRYPTALFCVVSAVIIATAPHWVRNLFAIGGGGIFN